MYKQQNNERFKYVRISNDTHNMSARIPDWRIACLC